MSLVFRLSIGANVLLLVGAGVLLMRDRPARPEWSKGRANPSSSEARADRPRESAVSRGAASRRSEPGDIRAAISRLEAAGVPRVLIADVLRQDFRRRWSSRTVDLENRYAPKEPPQREYIALERLRDREEIRALKEAFGEEGYLALDKEETLRKLNFEDVSMDATEAEKAYRLQKQLDDKLDEYRMAMEDGDADVADMGTLQMQAQDAYESGLRKLLGTERYNQLKGYTFPVVEGHLEFNELNPSQEQAVALNRAFSDCRSGEAALSATLKDRPADPAAIAAQLQALDDTRDAAIRQAVGAGAYRQLQREHDDDYQSLTQFAGAWNLPEAEIEPVYREIKAFQDRVDRLRQAAQVIELAGQTADWKSINSAIEQSRQQTETNLLNVITAAQVSRLSRNGLLSSLGSDRNAPHAPTGDFSSGQ